MKPPTPNSEETYSSTQEEVATFIRKLEKWSQALPENEKPLAQLLLERAKEIQPEHIRAKSLKLAWGETVREALKSFEERFNLEGKVWIKLGPGWVKKGSTEWGQEIKISHSTNVRKDR